MNRVHDPFSNYLSIFIQGLNKNAFPCLLQSTLHYYLIVNSYILLKSSYAFFFCEYVQQIAGKTSQLIGFWLFLRFVNGAIFFRGEREGRLMLPANNVFL